MLGFHLDMQITGPLGTNVDKYLVNRDFGPAAASQPAVSFLNASLLILIDSTHSR